MKKIQCYPGSTVTAIALANEMTTFSPTLNLSLSSLKIYVINIHATPSTMNVNY